ncbi:hypothetical protein ACQ4PT_042146 [Festuca glaucescens]
MEHSSTAMLDRLSDLPDALLLRILSLAFLGACRTLVKTSLVSRRWRHLWREVPCLEIDQREFLQEAAGPTTRHSKRDKRDPVKEWDRFEKFTENLLSRHSPDLPLDSLRLYVANPPQGHGRRNQSDASRLVRLCLERCRPVELGIYSNTLVDLRGLGLEIDLTRQTTLCLSDVVLRSSFAQHIGASGCPLLKHLQLEDCGLAFTELLLSRMLKTLSVFDTYNVHRRRGSVTRTRIEAPGLLIMMADKIDGVIFDAPSLVTAYVCPLLHRGCVDQEDDQLHILCGLQNATNLHLSGLPSVDKVH